MPPVSVVPVNVRRNHSRRPARVQRRRICHRSHLPRRIVRVRQIHRPRRTGVIIVRIVSALLRLKLLPPEYRTASRPAYSSSLHSKYFRWLHAKDTQGGHYCRNGSYGEGLEVLHILTLNSQMYFSRKAQGDLQSPASFQPAQRGAEQRAWPVNGIVYKNSLSP